MPSLASRVTDFSASGLPSSSSVKANVCDSAVWFTSET